METQQRARIRFHLDKLGRGFVCALAASERSYEFLQQHVAFDELLAVFVVREMFSWFGWLDSQP
jgi:hypothetical protein